MPSRSSDRRLLAARLTAQLLAGPPAATAEAVAERLLAVQAQDPRGARLAIRARTEGLTAADVDRALTETRSLVVTWLNRGTLHLVRSEDYAWVHALTTPPLQTGNARRLAQEGVTPTAAERAIRVIERSLTREGPLTREALRDRVAAAGVRVEGQALVHVLFLACARGIAIRGPMQGRRQAYALVRDWLGPSRPVDRGRSLAELARRYLAGHAPATDRDLARWAGLPLRDARAGLKAIAGKLEQLDHGLVALRNRDAPARLPSPRLLGAYEPLLLGWASREFVLGLHDASVVSGGLFRPVALVRGRAVAVWRTTTDGIRLEPLERLEERDQAALAADARRVGSFLGTGGRLIR